MSLLQHPEWLPGLLGLWLAAALALAASAWRARRRAGRLLGGARARRARPAATSDLALLLALGCVAAALVGPRLARRTVYVDTSGVDVVVLLDVSRSMDARDVPPSRLARARHAAATLLEGLGGGDRAALAVFAGRGVLLSPLTPDHDALLELLPALDSELLHSQGSRLGSGIEAALEAFEPATTRPRGIVVLSDGEDPEGSGETGQAAAVRAGVRVVAVALGSEAGARIPDADAWLRDASGRAVETRRQTARLRDLVEATDGNLLLADEWGVVDAAALRAAVRRDATGASGEPVARRVRAVAVLPLALAAFALLALEGTRRRRGRGPGGPLAAALVAGLALPGLVGAVDPALDLLESRARTGEARALLRLGVARAERGLSAEARPTLAAAALYARDSGLAALAYYDLGVVALGAGELAAARDAFFDALAFDPDFAEARRNLEWTLRALTSPEPPPAPGPEAGSESEAAPEQDIGTGNEPSPSAEAPSREETPTAAGRAETEPGAERFVPELDADAVEHWLEAVDDDPGRALRGALREDPERGAREGPRW